MNLLEQKIELLASARIYYNDNKQCDFIVVVVMKVYVTHGHIVWKYDMLFWAIYSASKIASIYFLSRIVFLNPLMKYVNHWYNLDKLPTTLITMYIIQVYWNSSMIEGLR